MTNKTGNHGFRSMTGCGRGTVKSDSWSVTVDLKSINNRFLDIRIKIPKGHSAIDSIMRKKIGQVCKRGTIDVVFNSQAIAAQAASVINEEMVEQYIKSAKTLATQHGVEAGADILSVMRLPGVLSAEDESMSDDAESELRDLTEQAVTKALEQLAKMRSEEGAELIEAIDREMDDFTKGLDAIAASQGKSKDDRFDKLKARVEKTLQKMDIEIDESRFLQEVAFYVERADITEEIDRLRSHIKQLKSSIASGGGAIGKKLDFLVQEMLREVNTIGSKTDTVSITDGVIAMKANLEKIREQIQNLE